MTSAQDDTNAVETRSCFPDMCDLLRDFGAMTEKVKAMERRLEESENEILELKNKEETKVIFSAAIGEGRIYVGPFNTDRTLIYRRVIVNIGNAYNKATGIFTAPVSGVYYFNIFYHTGGLHGAYLWIFKNSQPMVQTGDHKSSTDPNDNGGNSVFLQLQPGDHVYVRLFARTWVWGSDYTTTFSGFLVTPM
ncbi:complement C1q tumor necrosis factor-related protein 6-like [Cheilinus undulatus]|uniref:complement C1q tumor necrosis factor-related protein 6-like n=1 Tax=Cheilinus undulatus TaxID=241271 RepID=UPI001BD32FAE|nr:complement C1q tumor necrosis factor-related protein 6-like [Cheilinus undulatus]